MLVVAEGPSGVREVEVVVRHPSATVAALAEALGWEATSGLVVDGRPAGPGLTLAEAGMVNGAVVRPAGSERSPATPGTSVSPQDGAAIALPDLRQPVLAVTAGPLAGLLLPAPPGTWTIGRDPSCDVVLDHDTVSGRHARVVVDPEGRAQVEDLGSRNGTWVDGAAAVEPAPLPAGATLRLGALHLRFEPVPSDDAVQVRPAGVRGVIPFNRPPRQAPPPPPEPLPVPAPSPAASNRTPLNITALVAPVLFAAVLVVVLGSLRFAVFALLSPVLVLGNWLEGRRRARKAARGGDRQLVAALDELRATLPTAVEAERRRRHDRAPDPVECVRRAAVPSRRLWERRSGEPDRLVLHAGVTDLHWSPPLATRGEPSEAVQRVVEDHRLLSRVPATVDATQPVGVVGERDAAIDVARSLLGQAATHLGPADLRIAVVAGDDRVADWVWAGWLPHTVEPATGTRLVAAGDADADALLRRLRVDMLADRTGRARPARTGPTLLLVLDGIDLDRPDSPARALLRDGGDAVTALVVAPSTDRLPAACATVVTAVDGDAGVRVERPADGTVAEDVRGAGVTLPVARSWARLLARYEDVEVHAESGADLPPAVELAGLLDVDPFDPAAVAGHWAAAGARQPLAVPLGVGADGTVVADLDRDGPHALVVGTTGSGKSELLRSVVLALATVRGPEDLQFVLLDGKGGAAFDRLTELPHIAGLATDLDAESAAAAVTALEAELRRRERLLRSAGCESIVGHEARRDQAGLEPLARLVVVVDELAVLASDLPATVDALVDVGQRGRSLGMHLVLCTQRAAGVVTAAVKANVNLRVALRVQTEADSIEVVGTPAAAALPAGRPGRAVVRRGADDLTVVQSARTTGRTGGPGAPVVVRAFEPASRAGQVADTSAAPDGVDGGVGVVDLERMVSAIGEAAAIAGQAAATRLWADDRGVAAQPDAPSLAGLLGVASLDGLTAAKAWSSRPAGQTLCAPLGAGLDGEPVVLDLKEAAHGGMGPHGLVVGATGSGKSELLRTFVAGLVVRHTPEELALVLVDFKGGATFAPFARLPHVAGMITNLAGDLAMVDRAHAALGGELQRRQELLRAAGDLPSVAAYAEARHAGADLEPLPSLVVVVDEFAELLAARPEFVDVFGAIGRLGRSLGVHLLLASQRLEEGRLRGLESHLRFRIALRTFSTADSRAVLGSADAHRLPAVPGAALLQVDGGSPDRLQAGYVSGGSPSDLDTLVAVLRAAAPPVHQVWLPPLPDAVALDAVLGAPEVDPTRGLVATHWPGVGRLVVPLGVEDRPAEQAQRAWTLDLSAGGGNVAIVGAPRSGRSTALRTLVAALALTHTPTEAQVYAVDAGGGGLAGLAGLPHVGTVAPVADVELVGRVVRHVQAILAGRERRFAADRIEGVAGLRARRAAGELPDEPYGDVFLVLDGWAAIRTVDDGLEAAITDLAARGLGYGVHVVVGANRWTDLRPALRDSLGSRVELRLADPLDSTVDRRRATTVPADRPGRGLTPAGHDLLVALPQLGAQPNGGPTTSDGDGAAGQGVAEGGLTALVAAVAGAWPGPAAPPVRVLPERVVLTDLPAPGADRAPGVPIGIGEADLGPVHLDLEGGDPHLVVFGDGESGKTTLLAAFLAGLVARRSPGQARVCLVDPRRGLLDAVPEPHLLAHAGPGPAADDVVARLVATLERRLPGPDVTVEQLRTRSWWSGPHLYLVVDDLDLVAASGARSPLAPLVDLLPQGADIGFHVLVARRVAGASRALHEPFLQRLVELGAPGLVLSGDPREGVLIGGVRATEQPPGRGLLVRRRGGAALVQCAWVPR